MRPTAAACAAFMLLAAVSAAVAADASRWDGDERSAVRLIAGSRLSTGAPTPIRAGIEIRLKSGWHTYWRYPGDAGIPPHFDFAGSVNVQDVDVLWPAPQRLPVEGMISIGYEHHVILPLRVVVQDRGKPVTLRLKLDYAVCEKLCVPAVANAELALPGGASAFDAALAKAEAQVPKLAQLGETKAIMIKSVRRESAGTRPRVIVDVAAPAGAAVDLFAEGPSAAWAFPLPQPADGAPSGMRRYVFELDGAPPGASYDGVKIKLTATTGREAIEVSTRLD